MLPACLVSAVDGPRARLSGLDVEFHCWRQLRPSGVDLGKTWLATEPIALSPRLSALPSWKAWCRSVLRRDNGGRKIRIDTFRRWSECPSGRIGFRAAVDETDRWSPAGRQVYWSCLSRCPKAVRRRTQPLRPRKRWSGSLTASRLGGGGGHDVVGVAVAQDVVRVPSRWSTGKNRLKPPSLLTAASRARSTLVGQRMGLLLRLVWRRYAVVVGRLSRRACPWNESSLPAASTADAAVFSSRSGLSASAYSRGRAALCRMLWST